MPMPRQTAARAAAGLVLSVTHEVHPNQVATVMRRSSPKGSNSLALGNAQGGTEAVRRPRP